MVIVLFVEKLAHPTLAGRREVYGKLINAITIHLLPPFLLGGLQVKPWFCRG